jgi:microsomal dipeptidase-like Zn-dependent dipeptidase
MPSRSSLLPSLLALLVCLLSSHSVLAQSEIQGYVDMHAHPRGDLAYGKELFFGKPYGDIAVELGNCDAHHAAWGLGNRHGNLIRQKVAQQTEQLFGPEYVDGGEGYPDFKTWPSYCAILHQQMWVDWIARAHEGGLRIMVALVAHSHCIADAAETRGPYDDGQAIEDGVQGIKDLDVHADFMEIAYTAADVRRIVAAGRLAVIIGLETDNIGNFYRPADNYAGAKFNPDPSLDEIKAELDKLWGMGVRYLFPVHLTNNVFGGTALGMSTLNVPNKYNTGAEFVPEVVSTAETGIAFDLEHPVLSTDPEAEFLAKVAIRMIGGIMPASVNPSRRENYTFHTHQPGQGHRNALGISEIGRPAIRYMMEKGFMIDIDHMSEKMADAVLELAEEMNYPVNSGHNGLRDTADNENSRTAAQYRRVQRLGGMAASSNGEYATRFVQEYRKILAAGGFASVGIGTDVGGFCPLPKADSLVDLDYAAFPLGPCKTGNRTWDINVDGVAHYGMWPDYIESWRQAGMTPEELAAFMRSAEHFTRMWERCEMLSAGKN